MEPEELNKFKQLTSYLASNDLINIEENNINECAELAEYLNIDGMLESVLKVTGIKIRQSHQNLAYLTGTRLDWVYSKNEDWIYGGYSIDFFDCLWIPSHFWKIYNDPPESKEQEIFLKDLVYFQKSGHGDDGTFGCFIRNQNYDKYIVFYDNGHYMNMSIGLEAYIEALLKYKAVCGWQYFFIEPELIVKTLKHISCAKWPIVSLDYRHSRIKGSMVDAILFHMDKLIRLFPVLFPDVDLKEAIEKREKLATCLAQQN